MLFKSAELTHERIRTGAGLLLIPAICLCLAGCRGPKPAPPHITVMQALDNCLNVNVGCPRQLDDVIAGVIDALELEPQDATVLDRRLGLFSVKVRGIECFCGVPVVSGRTEDDAHSFPLGGIVAVAEKEIPSRYVVLGQGTGIVEVTAVVPPVPGCTMEPDPLKAAEYVDSNGVLIMQRKRPVMMSYSDYAIESIRTLYPEYASTARQYRTVLAMGHYAFARIGGMGGTDRQRD